MYLLFMLGRQNRLSLLWLVLSHHFQNLDTGRNYIQDQFEHLNREKIVGKTALFLRSDMPFQFLLPKSCRGSLRKKDKHLSLCVENNTCSNWV